MDNLFVGVKDWEREAWSGVFYPEDMPREWWLDYYSNQFSSVLVSESHWLNWQADAIEEFYEALEGETFYFFFEVLGDMNTSKQSQLQTIKKQLGALAYGIVWFDAPAIMEPSLEGFTLTYVNGVVDNSAWHYEWLGNRLSGFPLAVIDRLPQEPKRQAHLVSDFMQSLPEDQSGTAFFVLDEHVTSQSLKELQVMSEIMGF